MDEAATLFHLTDAYIYADPDGDAVGVEDVFTEIENARVHHDPVGLGADHVDRFIR